MRLTAKEDTDKWIAIVGGEVIAKGKELKEVYNEAKKICPDEEPIMDIFLGKVAMVG